MGKILALAGKKQSGKNTSANWILGLTMLELGIVKHFIHVDELGRLQVTDIWGDENFKGVFNYDPSIPGIADFLEEHVNPWFKMYSFADLLKREVCIGLLGLGEPQCFGTDIEKNSYTHLKWEDMPGVISSEDSWNEWGFGLTGTEADFKSHSGMIYHKPGHMTGREVMQFVGTDIFRKMYAPVWAKGTLNRIVKDNAGLAVITDCRFPDEVTATQEAGGKVARFLRDPFVGEDQHESETALDPENFDQSKFDALIDNKDMTVGEQNKALYKHLSDWAFVAEMQPEQEVAAVE